MSRLKAEDFHTRFSERSTLNFPQRQCLFSYAVPTLVLMNLAWSWTSQLKEPTLKTIDRKTLTHE